ncbi:hypothetical protein QYF36_020579 [Acer negundo]|nr:hypothetical protein QYF36_020579 [Acer negundo]
MWVFLMHYFDGHGTNVATLINSTIGVIGNIRIASRQEFIDFTMLVIITWVLPIQLYRSFRGFLPDQQPSGSSML